MNYFLNDGQQICLSFVCCRFYTKFHARRMHELTEVGLSNFTSLFLVLAMVTDMEDVVSRLHNEVFNSMRFIRKALRPNFSKQYRNSHRLFLKPRRVGVSVRLCLSTRFILDF